MHHHLSLPVLGALSTGLRDAWRRIDALLVEHGIEALVGTCAPYMGASLTWGRSHPGGAITPLAPKASLSCALRMA